MSTTMEEEIKRWTVRRKSALGMEILQGKTTVAEASRQFDLTPSEIEALIDNAKAGMENALKAKPEDIREQYERSSRTCMRLTARPCLSCAREKNCSPCWARTSRDRDDPSGTA